MSSGLPGQDDVVVDDHKARVASTRTERVSSLPDAGLIEETTTTTTTTRVSSLRDLVPDWYRSARPSQRTAGFGQGGHGARVKEAKAEYLQGRQDQILNAYEQGSVDFDTLCNTLHVDPAEAARHVASSATSETVPREVAQHAASAAPQYVVEAHPPNDPWDPNRVDPSTRDTPYGPDPMNTADPTPSWDRSAAQQAQDEVRPAILGSTSEEDQEALAARFAMELERAASIHDSEARCRRLVELLDLYITVPQVRRSPAMSLASLSQIWRRPHIRPEVLAAAFGVDYLSVSVEEDGYGGVMSDFLGIKEFDDTQQIRTASSRSSRRPVVQSIREYLHTLRK